MPTAPKMVAAVLLALLGYVVSNQIRPLMPEGTGFGIFNYVNAAIGFVCGWLIVGARAGRGISAGISNGFTAMVAMVFWGLFVQAANEMVRLAMRNRYSGPFEALADVFTIGVDYGATMMVWPIILTLFAGGVATGILAEISSRYWR